MKFLGRLGKCWCMSEHSELKNQQGVLLPTVVQWSLQGGITTFSDVNCNLFITKQSVLSIPSFMNMVRDNKVVS